MLGLDLGSRAVKAVEMTRSGEMLRVTSCSCEEVADPAAYAEAIRAVIEAGSLETGRVVAGFSGRGTLLQTVVLPSDNPGDMDAAIREEAAKYIPYGLDEARVDYHLMADVPDRFLRALVTAARRTEIDARLAILDAAGIAPVRLEPEPVALVNALETASLLAPGVGAGLIDFGAGKTVIAVTDGVEHVFREFPFGGDKLTEMIGHRMGLSWVEAERMKLNPGGDIETVKDAIYPGIEDITAEVRLCLERFRGVSGGREASLLMLSGGLVAFPGVVRLVSRLTRTAARVFGFGDVDASDLDSGFLAEHGHEFAVAFGLACHAREDGPC